MFVHPKGIGWLVILGLIVTVCIASSVSCTATAANGKGESYSMKQELDSYIHKEPKLKGGLIGVSIRQADTGKIIYEHMGNTRFRPASNMKLLTAATSLSVLGKDYQFSTELRTNGTIKQGRLNGNLYLVGKGDPTLLPETFDMFAAKLKAMDIDHISGDIIGDDTWYDAVRLSPDMIWSDEHYYYGAQVSALTVSPDKDYDAGTVRLEIQSGGIGEKPQVSMSPKNNYIEIKNEAITVKAEQEEDLIIEREHGTNIVSVSGIIPKAKEPIKEWIAVWEPTGYALDLLKQALVKQNITWHGVVKSGEAPIKSKLLFTHSSMTLAELLIPFMKHSNNSLGEILVKEMGKKVYGEGSWEQGIEALKRQLKRFGLNQEKLLIRDGSGISHVTLIPPTAITQLLYAVQKEAWFPSFIKSLPVAGDSDRQIGGTLRYRMPDLVVQAKTGTIYGVSTLSGYAEKSNKEKLIFSIMINNLIDEEEGKVIEDQLLEIIVDTD
ncbi:MAG: D-alanyl-D-alanine carboxypeptidase/D-alanyl-D-alanine endopeptidase [Bacillota bacterium]|uniref:D-alanyl-D-alanine carboxypeptidase/D-alanyl-D-alanine endopeptidase n=1 Tax=Virgibacillus sp. AGTR TaxID=2812055 RepID=UPI001962CE3B|nr:D-alanyl-D-alanine carboxypeptidase/D-alanyl-D-alanine-endopeptidase [Virgibacillus sp. AGTR]MCC2248380.1 D-alanyl-D-alanine carboxypeptidase/D-alanyl-D-alanine-endopeptidase [Virgibacillus sp. AGTR]QRZ16757.1 D-alanyl-D-alanine carboxypeptidase/D-alanyl-D-alanine-endopeptidase [Virgibacillus sp. AGTR]